MIASAFAEAALSSSNEALCSRSVGASSQCDPSAGRLDRVQRRCRPQQYQLGFRLGRRRPDDAVDSPCRCPRNCS